MHHAATKTILQECLGAHSPWRPRKLRRNRVFFKSSTDAYIYDPHR